MKTVGPQEEQQERGYYHVGVREPLGAASAKNTPHTMNKAEM
jgi:hypothetical protein